MSEPIHRDGWFHYTGGSNHYQRNDSSPLFIKDLQPKGFFIVSTRDKTISNQLGPYATLDAAIDVVEICDNLHHDLVMGNTWMEDE